VAASFRKFCDVLVQQRNIRKKRAMHNKQNEKEHIKKHNLAVLMIK